MYLTTTVGKMISAGLAVFCLQCQSTPTAKIVLEQGDSLALQEFLGNTVILQFEGNRKTWELKTTSIIKYPSSEETRIRPVDLVIYNGKDAVGNSTLIADQGLINKDMNVLEASGHVTARSYDGKILEAEHIRWDKNRDKVTSERLVQLTTETGDVLTGVGFESDASLNHWRIQRDFKAVLKNVKQRRLEKK